MRTPLFAALFALLAVIIAACGFVAPPTPPPAQPTDCPVSQVVYIPGSFETNVNANPSTPVGILGRVAAKVPAMSTFTPYPATFVNPFYPSSEQAGIVAATAELVATHAHCPLTKFALAGYSQGADAAGDLGMQIANGLTAIPADHLVGVALIADPKRNPDTETLVGPAVPGVGVAGARQGGFGSVPVVTYCATGDLVCSYTAPIGGDIIGQLRTFAASPIHTSYGSYVVAPGQTTVDNLAAWLTARLH